MAAYPRLVFSIRAAHDHELPLLAPLELRAAERFRDSLHAYACDLPAFDPEQAVRDGQVISCETGWRRAWFFGIVRATAS